MMLGSVRRISALLVVNTAGTVIENNRTLPYGEMWLPSERAGDHEWSRQGDHR